MTGLSGAAIVDLWEQVEGLSAVERALALASVGVPTIDRAVVLELPLGRRDERLLGLRREFAGDIVDAIATCPSCGEGVEFSTQVSSLLEVAPVDATFPPPPLVIDGYRVAWRPIRSDDLEPASAASSAAEADQILLSRCVREASGPDGTIRATELPPAVRAALSAAMTIVDPLAEVIVAVACPGCARGFEAELDIAEFVWAELANAAQRVMREVAVLASAFGWTEPEVLALADRRRATYLGIAREGAA